MLKKLRYGCSEKRKISERIAKVMNNKRLEKIIYIMWFEVLEKVLDEIGYDLAVSPIFDIPSFGNTFSYVFASDKTDPVVRLACEEIELPYEEILKSANANLTESDDVVWQIVIVRGDLKLSVMFRAPIPQEDIDLLTAMGVRKYEEDDYYPRRGGSYSYSCDI